MPALSQAAGYWPALAAGTNYGTTGSGLDATIGGDVLEVEGPAFWFPGSAGNYAETSAPAQTGDLIVRWRVDPGGFPIDASSRTIAARRPESSTTTLLWELLTFSSGSMRFQTTDDVHGFYALDISIGSISAGQMLEAEFDQSTSTFTMRQSSDGLTWATVGTPATQSREHTWLTSTPALTVGNSEADLTPWIGPVTDLLITWGSNGYRASDTWTINRSATGVSTVQVPDGDRYLINPDNTDTANKITTSDHADLDVPDEGAFTLLWAGELGNVAAVFGVPLATIGASTGSAAQGIRILERTDGGVTFEARGTSATQAQLEIAAVTRNVQCVLAFTMNDTAFAAYQINSSGTTLFTDTDTVAGVDAFVFAAGLTALDRVPSSQATVAFHPTVAYSEAELQTIAQAVFDSSVPEARTVTWADNDRTVTWS